MAKENYMIGMKIKEGEMLALQNLSPDTHASLLPLFDVIKPTEKTSIDKRISESLKQVMTNWPRSRRFLIDIHDISLEARLKNGVHPIEKLVDEFAHFGYSPIHCFGFDRGDDYEASFVKAIHKHEIKVIALRLEQADLGLLSDTIGKIEVLMQKTSIKYEDLLVIFDLRSIAASNFPAETVLLRAFNELTQAGVKKYVVMASSMWDYTRLPANKVTKVPRQEFALWLSLRSLGIEVMYGDYGVVSPEFIDLGNFKRSPSPKFRYTLADSWLVSKGEQTKAGELNQYPRIAKKLVARPEFRGNDLSWGNDQMLDISNYILANAALTKAVAIDTCTHLEVTVSQIRNIEKVRFPAVYI
jgi:Beta protein